mmetsp:Transcript_16767/g.40229  ORF Transcript_16767/g.40229 Transcript_16767/m.40229 type:complete len:231 (+) Transcript_16767:631-1323(+)
MTSTTCCTTPARMSCRALGRLALQARSRQQRTDGRQPSRPRVLRALLRSGSRPRARSNAWISCSFSRSSVRSTRCRSFSLACMMVSLRLLAGSSGVFAWPSTTSLNAVSNSSTTSLASTRRFGAAFCVFDSSSSLAPSALCGGASSLVSASSGGMSALARGCSLRSASVSCLRVRASLLSGWCFNNCCKDDTATSYLSSFSAAFAFRRRLFSCCGSMSSARDASESASSH